MYYTPTYVKVPIKLCKSLIFPPQNNGTDVFEELSKIVIL